MKETRIVLASTSPRRRDLLIDSGVEFEVRAPEAMEICEGAPNEIVVKNAVAKAVSVPAGKNEIVIGADTMVICNEEILGKPVDVEDAKRMIRMQVEHPQEVITGICVLEVSTGKCYTGYEISGVIMNGSEKEISDHLESGQWKGKAGAYGIQDMGPMQAVVTFGNKDNVIGLPMTLLKRLLSLVDLEYPEKTPSSGE